MNPPVGTFSDVYRIPVMFGLLFTPRRFVDLGLRAAGETQDDVHARTLSAIGAFLREHL